MKTLTLISFLLILTAPIITHKQGTHFTHKIKLKTDFIAATSLVDSKISILTNNDKVILVGKCKTGCGFNIIKIKKESTEPFAITQVRSYDEKVVLEILKDNQDTENLTKRALNLYHDTLEMYYDKNIDFVIPKEKKIILLHKGQKYAKIRVSKGEYCYEGFVKTRMIEDINFTTNAVTTCFNPSDNSIVKKEIYDNFVEGIYFIKIDYNRNNATADTRFEIFYHNNLLKVKNIAHNTYINGKKSEQESYGATKDNRPSDIIFYDRSQKKFYFQDFEYQFNAKNHYQTKLGWIYSIEKIQ